MANLPKERELKISKLRFVYFKIHLLKLLVMLHSIEGRSFRDFSNHLRIAKIEAIIMKTSFI